MKMKMKMKRTEKTWSPYEAGKALTERGIDFIEGLDIIERKQAIRNAVLEQGGRAITENGNDSKHWYKLIQENSELFEGLAFKFNPEIIRARIERTEAGNISDKDFKFLVLHANDENASKILKQYRFIKRK